MFGLIVLRAMGPPLVLLVGIVALAIARERAANPGRGWLMQFWGSTLLIAATMFETTGIFYASGPTADLARDAGAQRIGGLFALICLALGLALGWRVRLAGVRFLVTLVRPAENLTPRSLFGPALAPLMFLWLAVVFGAIFVMYDIVTWLRPPG